MMTWQAVLLTVAWAAALAIVLVGPALRPRGGRGDRDDRPPARRRGGGVR